MYILYNILIDIYHCSDCLLLLYYNKNETDFLAPQWKIMFFYHLSCECEQIV
jgi:hypothetical protein